MNALYIGRKGEKLDITDIVVSAEWSGDKMQCARELVLELVYSRFFGYAKVMEKMEPGEVCVLLGEDGEELFQGYIISIDTSIAGTTRQVRCLDGLFYLTNSEIAKTFKKKTAEEITKEICAELGVPLGDMASSGGKKYTFAAIGKGAYEAIMMGWTKALEDTGRRFIPRMIAGKLHILEKGKTVAARVLSSDTDILDASFTLSIENMVNRVRVVSDKGKLQDTLGNTDDQKKYGVLQKIYQKGSGEKSGEAQKKAKELLEEIERTASIGALIGGADCHDLITGNAVEVKEPVTGLVGKFYIDSDTHAWSGGNYMVTIGELRFENMMDEHEAEEK